jgi:hypothetical protein
MAFSGNLSKEAPAKPQTILLTSSIKSLEISSRLSESVKSNLLSSPSLDLYLNSKVFIILSSIPSLLICPYNNFKSEANC